jgi:membrane protease subunit HflC
MEPKAARQVARLLSNVTYTPARFVLIVDAEPMLTAEKQRVVIDWYVRWRNTSRLETEIGLTRRLRRPVKSRGEKRAFL